VNATQGSFALMPIELATPRLRTMRLEGMNLYQAERWPEQLVETVWVSWSGQDVASFALDLARRLSLPAPAAVRILGTGDVVPARCVYAKHLALNDFAHAFRATADFLRAADITVGTFDAGLSDLGEPIGCERTFSLLAPAKTVEGLVLAGFDVLSLAANHVKDCGRNFCGDLVFIDSLKNLKAAGIQPVGGGMNRAEAHEPVIITVKGVRFAFLAYDDISPSYNGAGETTPGTAELSEAALREDIARARQEADVVIVLPQWGIEYEFRPSSRQRNFARIAFEAGASLVIGNHPHVVQGVEWFGDGFVAYALGNFVYDQDWSIETEQGAVLEATFVGSRLVEVRFHPVRIHDMHQPRWAGKEEAQEVLDRMRRASPAP
jgi:poly-gamma-glutamate capsule biosynthesis protein CapA/YwtB (metallophosphatase superfamily)